MSKEDRDYGKVVWSRIIGLGIPIGLLVLSFVAELVGRSWTSRRGRAIGPYCHWLSLSRPNPAFSSPRCCSPTFGAAGFRYRRRSRPRKPGKSEVPFCTFRGAGPHSYSLALPAHAPSPISCTADSPTRYPPRF